MAVANDQQAIELKAENDGGPRMALTVPNDKVNDTGPGPEFIGRVQETRDEGRWFTAWGTIEAVDKKNTIIKFEALRDKLEKMTRRGASGAPLLVNHSHHVVGSVPIVKPANYTTIDGKKIPAVWIEGHVFKDYRMDDEVWEKVKSGELNSISIGGRSYDTRLRCNPQGSCVDVIEDMEPTEWSLTEAPVMPLAKITEVIRSEVGGEIEIIERVREPILKHYRDFGLDGKCDPCTQFIKEVGESIGDAGKGLDIAKSMLDSAVLRYDEWYKSSAELDVAPMNDEDKKTVQEIVKAEVSTFAADFKASMDGLSATIQDVKKSLEMATDEKKSEVMGAGNPKETGKSLEYSQEYQDTVKAEVEKAKGEILKSLSLQMQEMVSAKVTDVQKAATKPDEGQTVQTPPPVTGDVRKSGADIGHADDEDPMAAQIRKAWETGDVSQLPRP